MKMNTYVNFRGTCAEAFHYYEKHLGARVGMMMTHAELPEPTPVDPDWKGKVLHARIFIGDTELMGADIPSAEPMRSAYITLRVESDKEAERVFAALRWRPNVHADAGNIFRIAIWADPRSFRN